MPATQAIKLAEAMTAAGVPGRVELLVGAQHGWGGAELERTKAETFAFFDRISSPRGLSGQLAPRQARSASEEYSDVIYSLRSAAMIPRPCAVEHGRLDGGEAEEAVVEHLLEDLEVAQEGGGGMGVAVEADRVGVRLEQGEAVGQGGVGRVVRAVLGGSGRATACRNGLGREADTRRRGRRRRGWGSRGGWGRSARGPRGRGAAPRRP